MRSGPKIIAKRSSGKNFLFILVVFNYSLAARASRPITTILMAINVLESNTVARNRQRKNAMPKGAELGRLGEPRGEPPMRFNGVVQCGQRVANEATGLRQLKQVLVVISDP